MFFFQLKGLVSGGHMGLRGGNSDSREGEEDGDNSFHPGKVADTKLHVPKEKETVITSTTIDIPMGP